MGAIWAWTVVAFLATLIRLYARYRGPRRLYLDGYLVILVTTGLLILPAAFQAELTDFYKSANPTGDGISEPGPSQRSLKVGLSIMMFYYIGLALVKISILFFVITLTAALGIGTLRYECYLGAWDYILAYCPTLAKLVPSAISVYVTTALNVLTDFLIMFIPIRMVWNQRLPRRKKAALFGLVALSLWSITIALVRVVQLNGVKWADNKLVNTGLDASRLYLWSILELCTAVLVACCASFPQLFRRSKTIQKAVRQQQQQNSLPGVRSGRMRARPAKLFGSTSLFSSFKSRSELDVESRAASDNTNSTEKPPPPILVPGQQPHVVECSSPVLPEPAQQRAGGGDSIIRESGYSVATEPASEVGEKEKETHVGVTNGHPG
ncbi:hypothetical protein B0H66DRAFT_554345 [Apodospora peruviana]|uniref:Rhodopsin domain-containing protein n=1 Tax=Apodospora peruviana TaxID=516989 RepID=A0AAE0IC85_9PEZI|nr:hypothetical protein B0H66DRAFT_554345 [Apodospora peruviana]